MIQKKETAAPSLFLMELILAILFFALSAAVCVQFFGKAHLLSRDSRALSLGTHQCASIAEVCKAAGDEQEARTLLESHYPQAQWDGDTMTLYFDGQFSPCSGEDHAYRIQTRLRREDTMLRCSVTLTDAAGTSLLTLEPGYHIPRRTGYGQG